MLLPSIARLLVVCGIAWAILTTSASADETITPQSPILTIESERLFSDSAFGRRVAREFEEDSAALATENRRIEGELTAEERALTDQRPDMDPAAFRNLADAFDAKVQSIRQTQDNKARNLSLRSESHRLAFLRAARPVLERLMVETGAAVLLERSSVFFSANSTDVTDVAIQRIDAAIGDGTLLENGGGAAGDLP